MRSEVESRAWMVTYKLADGELIQGEFGWVTELDYFDEEDEPIELLAEHWVRTEVRSHWVMPRSLYSCTKVEECDEDAVRWEQQSDGQWVQTCEEHVR